MSEEVPPRFRALLLEVSAEAANPGGVALAIMERFFSAAALTPVATGTGYWH